MSWTFCSWEQKQEGRTRRERGKRRESSAEVSRHQGFDEHLTRIFYAGSPRHTREIRDAGKSGKIQILRLTGSSGRQTTKIQLILRNKQNILPLTGWLNSEDKYSAVNDSVRNSKGVFRSHCASMAHRPRWSTGDGHFGKSDFVQVTFSGASVFCAYFLCVFSVCIFKTSACEHSMRPRLSTCARGAITRGPFERTHGEQGEDLAFSWRR